jgi:2-oxoglutarate dehydrogenase E1 component
VRLLERLTAAEGWSSTCTPNSSGQKRFSLEGGECHHHRAGRDHPTARAPRGWKEIVIGMAHRGRLNVLVNIMGKSPKELFEEFEGKHDWKGDLTGDVKYHQGYSSDVQTPGGIVHLALGFNPVAPGDRRPGHEGSVRARQERRGDRERDKVLPRADPRRRGLCRPGRGIRDVQPGPDPRLRNGRHHPPRGQQPHRLHHQPSAGRALHALYCTDVGKVIQAPIFHVNGDDPEAVAFIRNWP